MDMKESISKITHAFESAKDLTMDAAVAASSRFGTQGMYKNTMKNTEVRDLLDYKGDRSLKKAMKYLLYQISFADVDFVKSVLPDVLKNINCPNIKTRRMVYVFLLRFAELDPDTSLLAINSIQQTLVEKNPEMRSLALEVLSSMKIASIYPLVFHSTKELVRDNSYKVRCTVGRALSRLHKDKAIMEKDLLPLIMSLFQDSDFRVVSSVVSLYKTLVFENQENLEKLHPFYRRFVGSLEKFESNCFKDLIDILIKYSKTYLTPESKDFDLLMDNLNGKVLDSFDASVIIVCAKAVYELSASEEIFKNSSLPLALIKAYSFAENEIKEIVLQCILYFLAQVPDLFHDQYSNFILLPGIDSEKLMVLKVQVLTSLCDDANCMIIIEQLEACAVDPILSLKVRKTAILSLATCSAINEKSSKKIMKWLLNYFHNSPMHTVEISNAIITLLRCLVFRVPEENVSTVWLLSKLLLKEAGDDDSLSTETHAGIIWLVGEFVKVKFEIACEVLKTLIPTFSYQDESVRLQILTLSAKILAQHMENSGDKSNDTVYFKMFSTLLKLAEYDDNYDIRDRARTYSGLLKECGAPISSLVLQAPKLSPTVLESGLFISYDIQEYLAKSEWNQETVILDDSVRDHASPVKDYTQAKKGISSSDYFKQEKDTSLRSSSQSSFNTPDITRKEAGYLSSSKETYKLKSLDEFFSEVPTTQEKNRRVRKVIVEEETSSEEESSEEESSEEESSEEESEEEESEDNTSKVIFVQQDSAGEKKHTNDNE